jgi:hypothetical protein
MSQSDYIRFKKMSVKMKNIQNKQDFPQVVASQDYTNYLEYSQVNKCVNTKTTFQLLDDASNIFDVQMSHITADCPTFICPDSDGNYRPNVFPMTGFLNSPVNDAQLPVTTPVRKYVKHPSYEKTAKVCAIHTSCYDPACCKSLH